MLTPIIVPVSSQEQVVSNTGCPEDKPYYIEVSDDAWKCATETEYQEHKKSNNVGVYVLLGVLVILAVVFLMCIAAL